MSIFLVPGPLLLTIGAALFTMYGPAARKSVLTGRRVPLGLLIAQVGTVPLAWIVISRAPDTVSSYSGATCTDLSAAGAALYLLMLGSALLGGFAWGAAGLQSDSSLGRLFGYAAVSICLPYAIGVWWIMEVACSTWN